MAAPATSGRLFALARALVAAALLTTLAWAVITLAQRPLDGVEGDILFEADRIRSAFPLYVDPNVGAPEYGAPPARYLVLYPPLWSAALSLLPRQSEIVLARLVATLSWLGAIALVAWWAPDSRRKAVLTAGAFVAGIWVLALYGASARPDAAAVLLSTFALERVSRRAATGLDETDGASFDAVAGVAFALAAWTKPNVVGAFPGAVLGALFATHATHATHATQVTAWMRARRVVPGVLAFGGTSFAVIAVLHRASGGAWLGHLLASTGQPPSARLWLEQLAARGPFFLGPLLAIIVLGARRRASAGPLVATSALVTSLAWALLSLAKTGSATNYFLEPCMAALVVLARTDLPALEGRTRTLAAGLVLAQVAWNGAASIGGAIRGVSLARTRAAVLADARTTCQARSEELVIADEPGIELALNGRIVMTPFQTTHRVRKGRFDETLWLDDIASPRVTCLVMQDDLLERDLGDERVAHDRFTPSVRRALRDQFEVAKKDGGYIVYRRRADGSGALRGGEREQ